MYQLRVKRVVCDTNMLKTVCDNMKIAFRKPHGLKMMSQVPVKLVSRVKAFREVTIGKFGADKIC